jgi:predicted Zn-dependent protease with MMP-like domain
MERNKFKMLVERAIEQLPAEFAARLENVEIVVSDAPSAYQLRKMKMDGGSTLLGLYEGVPLTKRGVHYNMVPPDKITLFQKPIEAVCNSAGEIAKEVTQVLFHELAHHFGLSDAELREIARKRNSKIG